MYHQGIGYYSGQGAQGQQNVGAGDPGTTAGLVPSADSVAQHAAYMQMQQHPAMAFMNGGNVSGSGGATGPTHASGGATDMVPAAR